MIQNHRILKLARAPEDKSMQLHSDFVSFSVHSNPLVQVNAENEV